MMADTNIIYEHKAFDQTHLSVAHGETKYGQATYAWTDQGLCWFGFGDNTAHISKRFSAVLDVQDQGQPIPDMPIVLYGTDFQRSVWKALLEVPHAQTRTYKDIATAIGKPNAVRAVGTAIGRNPISLYIPCHRIVRSDGNIGHYLWGANLKQKILDAEKINVDGAHSAPS